MGFIAAHERMSDAKLRQAIALEAARLMYERVESEYFTAKRKAAKRLCRGGVKPEDLPSNAEIREQIQLFARLHEGEKRTRHLLQMRLESLRLMRLMRPFRPRLIGSVMTGHVPLRFPVFDHSQADRARLDRRAGGPPEARVPRARPRRRAGGGRGARRPVPAVPDAAVAAGGRQGPGRLPPG